MFEAPPTSQAPPIESPEAVKSVAELRKQFSPSKKEASSGDVSFDETSEAKSVAQLREQFLKSVSMDSRDDTKSSPKTVSQLKEEFSKNEGSSPPVQSPITSDNEFKLSSPKYDKKMQELFDRKYRLSSQRFEVMQKQGIQPTETSKPAQGPEKQPEHRPNLESATLDVPLEKLRSQALDVSRSRSPNHDVKMQELFNRRNRPGSDV